MTTIDKIKERDELVKKSERGEISPKELWSSLKKTYSEMSSWDKFVEYSILTNKRLD